MSLDLNAKAFATSLSAAQLSSVAKAFCGPSADCTEAALMAGGLSNTNMRATVRAAADIGVCRDRLHPSQVAPGCFLLKVCDEKNVDELVMMAGLQLQLQKHGFGTCYPVPLFGHQGSSDAADYVLVLEGDDERLQKEIRVMLFPFLKGTTRPFSAVTAQIVRDVARSLADMHSAPLPREGTVAALPFAMGLAQMEPFVDDEIGQSHELRTTWWDHEFVKFLREQMIPRFRQKTVDAVRMANASAAASVPQAIVHADCFPDNCLFSDADEDRDALVAIIDLEEVCIDVALLDVAMTIVGFCFPRENALDRSLYDEFIAAYDSHRTLSSAEKSLLPEFCAYAAGSCAFWRFRQFNFRHPEDTDNRNRHEEMWTRVRLFWELADSSEQSS